MSGLLAIWVLLAQPLLPAKRAPRVPTVSPERLEAHVRMLSETFAPRDWQSPQNLERVADYAAAHFEAAGARVERQPFTVHGQAYQNVIGHLGPESGERIILGAHYDTYGKLPGADDNASGVAVLLELAGILVEAAPMQPVDLVAYSLEEPPYFWTSHMGSAVHAADVKRRGLPVAFMASIEMVGYFSDAEGSQEPSGIPYRILVPSRGNFIAVVGRLRDGALTRRVKAAMRRGSEIISRT